MLGPYGDLKTAAQRPGPGSYPLPSTLSPMGGAKFGLAQRALTQNTSDTLNHTSAINKVTITAALR
jgi:hypothetical protein